MPESLTPRAGAVIPVTEDGRPTARIETGALSSILVVKLDFIGDWVLTTPFLADLRRAAPGAFITAIVLDRVFELAVACRLVDRVLAVPAANVGPVRFAAASAGDLAAFLADFGFGAFDLAFVPRWDTDFNGALRIADASGARTVLGFSERCTPRKQVDNRGDDRFYTAALLDLREGHEIIHDGALVAAIGGTVSVPELRLDIRPEDWTAADAFLRDAFGASGRPVLAVAPFAASRKQLPVTKTTELVKRLVDRFGLDVVAVGSPEHAKAAAEFVDGLGLRAVSSAGRIGMREGAALIGRASVLLGMDSSPGHIAAALGTPAAIVFPNARDASPHHVGAPERFRPWASPAALHLIRPPTLLPPCREGCDADEAHCIATISVDVVFPALAGFVGAALAGEARRDAAHLPGQR